MFLHVEKSRFRAGEYTALAGDCRWRIIRCDDYWRAVAQKQEFVSFSETTLRQIDARLAAYASQRIAAQ